jgi:subtilisin family serine protease
MNNVIFDNTLRPWLQGLSESLGTAALSYVGQTASFRFPWTTTLGSDLYLGSGTSFAAPHVAAIAALLRGAVPTATAAQIRSALESTALDLGPAGRDNTYGKGLVRALAACRSLGGCL